MDSQENLAKTIEAICGPPKMTSHAATAKIAAALDPLREQVNRRLAEGGPWQPFGAAATGEEQLNFIRAAAHFFPDDTFRVARLVTIRPPDHIHRMQRADPYWVGDFYSANLVVHALHACKLGAGSDLNVLDIGCSSGSLVRVLAAYAPGWRWFGRDPIRSAVEWAAQHVVTGDFAAMANKPPLDFADNSLDGVTAISVWSHHRPDAAAIWANEVARVLRPGGWFVVTFSSLHHLRWSARQKRHPLSKQLDMLRDVCTTGNHFYPMNYAAEDNDTGADWGQSCYSRERFFGMFLDRFDFAGHFGGLNQGNQDVAVLIKRR